MIDAETKKNSGDGGGNDTSTHGDGGGDGDGSGCALHPTQLTLLLLHTTNAWMMMIDHDTLNAMTNPILINHIC